MATNNTNSNSVTPGTAGGTNIPTNIVHSGLISKTCVSSDCFIDQQFSNKLQAFLIGYVNSIYSNYSVYI